MYGNGQDVKSYAGTASGGVAVATAVNRIPLVAEQVTGLHKRVDVLQNLIGDVESRFSAVLAPEPPSNEASTKAPQHGIGLVDGLVDVNARIESAISRLASVVRRAEL